MDPQTESRSISIPVPGGIIEGDLNIPAGSRSTVMFAHGSGSSRHSPRNKYVAEVLNRAGFSTLLLDLLTPDEEAIDERTGHLRFDIGLLADRLIAATDWLGAQPGSKGRQIGYFGASTGAAAALVAAARRPALIAAVVSRGGRADLAGPWLSEVRAPTLLIVGALDEGVMALNRQAAHELGAAHKIETVPGATHLFEEPGALAAVAAMACRWFEAHMVNPEKDIA
jgi:dienelactone hydrolase